MPDASIPPCLQTQCQQTQCQQTQLPGMTRSPKTCISPHCKPVRLLLTNNREHGFFRLPPELRIMIYKCCLVPGKIRPYVDRESQRELPGLPLLRTCKAILNEAGYELYKNTFIVSDWEESDLIFEACLRYPERRPMLKSLELKFGTYELHSDNREEVRVDLVEEYPPEAFQQFGSRASTEMERVRRREAHLRLKDVVREDRWSGKMLHILDDTELEHLRLNLEECYCDLECCDLYYNAFWTFAPGFEWILPKRLELVGVPESDVESLREDWVQMTTFGTLTRMRTAPVEREMIKQLKGWDFDTFMENVTDELEDTGET